MFPSRCSILSSWLDPLFFLTTTLYICSLVEIPVEFCLLHFMYCFRLHFFYACSWYLLTPAVEAGVFCNVYNRFSKTSDESDFSLGFTAFEDVLPSPSITYLFFHKVSNYFANHNATRKNFFPAFVSIQHHIFQTFASLFMSSFYIIYSR